ncbi:MAG: roadblock/LC7 domain-containing protein [Lentisphaeria bacterium]|nr:roadblock/LC7 domain-containing protein [Lentisphaeria bacterium]NQZ67065.1 roadblock/LC7 domain-containing protein [Lentisphaeria bacterium]
MAAFELNEANYLILHQDLTDFLEHSEACSVMLCDRGGNIIVSNGDTVSDSIDIISALVAGAFAATQQLANVIGEDEFTAIFHQGKQTSIFISAVGEEVLLLALFDNNTTAGLVKMYALNTINKIKGTFADIMDGTAVDHFDPTASFVISQGPIFDDPEESDK